MKLKHRFVKCNDSSIVQLLYHLDKIKDPLSFHQDPKTFTKNNNIYQDIFKQQTIHPKNEKIDANLLSNHKSKSLSSYQLEQKRAVLKRRMEMSQIEALKGKTDERVKDVLTIKYQNKRKLANPNDNDLRQNGKLTKDHKQKVKK